ncbi:MAG: hypothetical protein GEU88_14650 [Solirubrobacterales bacterium]|nr:hypothetical protein [Solirubrobacterales bacterium]
MLRATLLIGVLAALLVPARAGAVTLEPVGEFQQPVFVTSMPSDPNRLLVVEQAGRIQLVDRGVRSTFLDLGDLVVSGRERGLLSVALAPDYEATGHLYVFYTRAPSGDLQIDELTASQGIVALASRRPVLSIAHSRFANHNGGQLQFGADGYLYIGTGDGGGSNDALENAQSLSSLLGKLLRIDPRRSGSAPYTVPADNPFVGVAGARAEIWSYGLRNPWRYSFDRATGDLLIGDVGQGAWEEVDYARAPRAGAGVNYGWDCREGRHPLEPAGCPAASRLTDPILEYPHPPGVAITGGYVARDPSLGDVYGRYLYADLAVGQIRSLVPGLPDAIGDRAEGLGVPSPVSFGEDSCGRLYVVSLLGPVERLVGATPSACVGASSPSPPGAASPPPTNPGPPRCAGRPATIVATPGSPTIGTAGADVIAGGPGADRIRGRGGRDRICGARGRDRLTGGRGKDRLGGGRGQDRLRGGQGRDRLAGGRGTDRCRGGPGRDERRSC